MKNYKILYISDCYIYGGSERNIINLMNYMSEEAGNDIVFGYRYFKVYEEGVERDLSPKVSRMPLRLLSNITLFFNIHKKISSTYICWLLLMPLWILQKIGIYSMYNYMILRYFITKIKPDIVHVNNGGYPASSVCINAVFAAKHSGVNSIVFHINNPADIPRNPLQRYIDGKIYEYTSMFVSGSHQTQKSLQINRGFGRNKLLQLYNTVEKPRICEKRGILLDKYNIDHECFIVTEVAFLSKRKGQIFLLEAMVKIKQKDPNMFKNIVVFLVGDGESHSQLIEFCRINGLSNVIFTGYLPDYADYINAADLFVLPSVGGEDMPLVVLVAMALGKAIISTSIAGITEEIENGVSGVLLATSELEDLDHHIMKLYSDHNLRELYAHNALKRFHDLFQRDKIYKQYELLYEQLTHGGI